MNGKQNAGQRNLTILIWMGLVCQIAGVLLVVSALVGLMEQSGTGTTGGALLLVFGIALAGWAGNLSEITLLKK